MPDEPIEKEKHYQIWQNTQLRKPPKRAEFILNHERIDRAYLSFTFDMHDGSGTRLDITQPVLINDKPVSNLDLPTNGKSKSLEYVERKNIEITSLLRTSTRGESNTVEVNYLLSPIGIAKIQNTAVKLGTLSLDITIYPSVKEEIITFEFACIWCRKHLSVDWPVCPYCSHTAEQVWSGHSKRCPTCRMINPLEAKYCLDCGNRQIRLVPTKMCINCSQVISVRNSHCMNCGTFQMSQQEQHRLEVD